MAAVFFIINRIPAPSGCFYACLPVFHRQAPVCGKRGIKKIPLFL